MSIDLNAKTTQTTIGANDAIVAVDKTQATTSDKPRLIDPTAVGGLARMKKRNVAGTTDTALSTDNNTMVGYQSDSDCTVTLPNDLPVGWSCMWVQEGAGQIIFDPASGATLNHYQGHDASADVQWAIGGLSVIANSGGSAAVYVLSGITAAA